MHPEKFVGQYQPIFKSFLEYKFMLWADKNPNVVSWGYESFPIKYLDSSSMPPKVRNYYIDFVILAKDEEGKFKKIWVEIKHSSEVKKPKNAKNIQDNLTWLKNQCKWKAATQLAASRGCSFVVLTEKQLD